MVAPCAPHVFDLAVEDIDKLDVMKGLSSSIREIVKFYRNHVRVYAALRRHVSKALLLPCETCFKTTLIMIGRAYQVKSGLQKTLFEQEFIDQLEQSNVALRLKAEEIKQLVLDDDLWQRANIVIKMGKPIFDVLDLSNSDGPTAGKIYDKCFQVRVHMILFRLAVLMQFYLSNSPL